MSPRHSSVGTVRRTHSELPTATAWIAAAGDCGDVRRPRHPFLIGPTIVLWTVPPLPAVKSDVSHAP